MLALLCLVGIFPVMNNSLPIDLVVGSGAIAETGDRYSIAFRVEGPQSRNYADTFTRGLSYTKELGDGHDGYLDQWVSGMSVGSLRKVLIEAGQLPEMGSVLPAHESLVVTIKLISVRKKHRQ